MSRERYEVYCGGRLLKVIEQIPVPDQPMAARDHAGQVIDGQHHWIIDGQVVADDVAQAVLAAHAPQTAPATSSPEAPARKTAPSSPCPASRPGELAAALSATPPAAKPAPAARRRNNDRATRTTHTPEET